QAMFVKSTVGAAELYEEDGVKYVRGIDEYEQEVSFVLGEETVIINEQGEAAELEDGAQFTAFTAWDKPAPLVLPPVYYPDAIVIDSDVDLIVDADAYYKTDETYTNAANTLAITAEGAEITDVNGEAYEGELDGKNLVVIYGITTRSLPPIASGAKVIVLGDATPIPELDTELPVTAVAAGDKTVEIVQRDGVDMVAVREVSEALGLDVAWDNNLKAVTVGTVPMGVNFRVGENAYNKARMTPFELEAAPVLEETAEGGVTYVPVRFFAEVLGCEVTVADGVMTLSYNY
ncbi:MAG: copper amine oxidase N-terminal domain-containing protein, partial [Clostridia bacterium]|nr:copper amine oxidase N-terminal domain-containing protein [Clostridia bacterium]